MALLRLALPIVSAAASLGVGALMKPRRKDYRPDLSYLDKYIANLRSDNIERSLERNILRQSNAQIGDASRAMQEQAEYQAARSGVMDSGITLQQQQQASQQSQTAMAGTAQEAMRIGEQRASQTRQAIAQTEMERDRIRSQAKADYNRAKHQWTMDMVGRGVQGTIGIAGEAIEQAIATKDAAAQAAEMIPDKEQTDAINYGKELLKGTGAIMPQTALDIIKYRAGKQELEAKKKLELEQGREYYNKLADMIGAESNYDDTLDPKQNIEILKGTQQFKNTKAFNEVADSIINDADTNFDVKKTYNDLVTAGADPNTAIKQVQELQEFANKTLVEEREKAYTGIVEQVYKNNITSVDEAIETYNDKNAYPFGVNEKDKRNILSMIVSIQEKKLEEGLKQDKERIFAEFQQTKIKNDLSMFIRTTLNINFKKSEDKTLISNLAGELASYKIDYSNPESVKTFMEKLGTLLRRIPDDVLAKGNPFSLFGASEYVGFEARKSIMNHFYSQLLKGYRYDTGSDTASFDLDYEALLGM